MATDAEYIDRVWYRLTKGVPQPESKIWRIAVESTRDAALGRLADRVAADDGLASTLFTTTSITLGAGGSAGQDPIHNLTPELVLTEAARRRWRVTMTGVRFSLQYRPTMHDIEIPSPVPDPDVMRYTLFNKNIVVRDFNGAIPAQTALQIYGSYVPLITDASIENQLFDNLVDIGIELALETGVAAEVIRAAQIPHAVTPMLAPSDE